MKIILIFCYFVRMWVLFMMLTKLKMILSSLILFAILCDNYIVKYIILDNAKIMKFRKSLFYEKRFGKFE